MTSPADRGAELRRRAEQWLETIPKDGMVYATVDYRLVRDLLTARTEQESRIADRDRALDDWMLRVSVLEAELQRLRQERDELWTAISTWAQGRLTPEEFKDATAELTALGQAQENRAIVLERYAQERDAAGDRDTALAIRELATLTAVIEAP